MPEILPVSSINPIESQYGRLPKKLTEQRNKRQKRKTEDEDKDSFRQILKDQKKN